MIGSADTDELQHGDTLNSFQEHSWRRLERVGPEGRPVDPRRAPVLSPGKTVYN